MAKFNDYSRYMKKVEVIPFEFLGETFKVKNSQWNSFEMTEASKIIQEVDLEEKRLGEEATEEERAELNIKQMEANNRLLLCIKNVLGDEQFKRLQKMDISVEGYSVLITILFGLINGATHEQIKEQLDEQFEVGEQEEPKKQNYNKKKHKK